MTKEHKAYLKKQGRYKAFVMLSQALLLLGGVGLWELAANLAWIDPFIFSSPTRMYGMLQTMLSAGTLLRHVWITSMEVALGFAIGSILGMAIAVLLWANGFCRRVFNPFLVVFNALPKTALAPIIIVWVGNNIRAVIVIALLISVVVTVLNILTGLMQVEEDKIKLLESFQASRLQVLTKAVIPGSMPSIMNALKVNIGLSFVGVIVGEFLVAREGLGFMIIHGSQVFRMDMVMLSIVLLCFMAALFYGVLVVFERLLKRLL